MPVCRSLHNLGILGDEQAARLWAQMAKRFPSVSPPREPIINRGTLIRTLSIDRIVADFYTQHKHNGIIISLGCGFDTRRQRLGIPDTFDFFEVDLPIVGRYRQKYLGGGQRFVPCNLYDTDDVWSNLPQLSPQRPSLLLAECVFMYLDTPIVKAILRGFIDRAPMPGSQVVIFDPIRKNDTFGKQMNFYLDSQRGAHLKTREELCDLLVAAAPGEHSKCSTMLEMEASIDWASYTQDALRASALVLDEREEWEMMASHYLLLHAPIVIATSKR